jgi:hypothetical protein
MVQMLQINFIFLENQQIFKTIAIVKFAQNREFWHFLNKKICKIRRFIFQFFKSGQILFIVRIFQIE